MKKFFIYFMCFFMVFGVTGCGSKEKKIEWPNNEFSKLLPKPETMTGTLGYDSEDQFHAVIKDITKKDFQNYVESCKKKGFDIEPESKENNYTAFNTNGYKLKLSYSEYKKDKHYSIYLYAPKKNNKITWPTTGVASLIPAPATLTGELKIDTVSQLLVYLNGSSMKSFEPYIEECKKKGFTVGYSKSDKIYSAEDNIGNSLRIEYYGFNIISISMRAKNDKDVDKPKKEPETKKEEPTKVSVEFKTAIDSYELFFDEYIAFMNKYANSTDMASMLNDYNSYLTKYTDTMNKMNNVNKDSLSTADALYYTEVNARIVQKLAAIAKP